MKYVIIGCSAAGLAAAKEIRRAENSAEIIIISEEDNPFYFRSYLIDYIIGRMDDQKIRNAGRKIIERFNLQLVTGQAVVGLKIASNTIRYGDSSELLTYDSLLIATGRKLMWGLLEKFKSNAMILQTQMDAVFIKGRLDSPKKVLICGGGLIAFELAVALKFNGHSVEIISDEFHFWQNAIGSFDRRSIEAKLKQFGIEWKLIIEVNELTRDKSGMYNLVTDDGSTKSADIIIAAYPRRPSIDFMHGSGLEINSGIIVTEDLRCNVANVFAAGDVAEIVDKERSSGRMNYGWRSAARQGEVAGRNMVEGSSGNTLMKVPNNDAFIFDFVGGEPLTRWQ